MKTIIDPPGGWRYGYPDEWEQKESLEENLRRHKYPEKDIEFALNYMRIWHEEETVNA